MKKMKLLSFVLSGILAVSSMCGITASASDLYEIPESITSIKELEDFITSPLEISAKDYVRLCNQMTAETIAESVEILADEITTDEKITDLKEIESLIKSFIGEESLPSGVGIEVWHDIEGKEFSVLSVIAYPWDADKIKNFMAENNIDNTKVAFFIRPVGRVEPSITGDVNDDKNVNVRDCAEIAKKLADGKAADLPDSADYNKDGVKNIRDAATLAKELA